MKRLQLKCDYLKNTSNYYFTSDYFTSEVQLLEKHETITIEVKNAYSYNN